ncbi:DUF3052 domain-containing protein [Paenibacillus lutrae]|uniref:DUF3052 domain-containing protein n=1 Tax=Paenibacillus lutrae TaxID=2078573 RepID=A0A7X3FG20_9BACL|nr:DUF3052 domain-containing protein [Paenibacillus lutrae]MVO98726.1 DUF3052 domain-containing protein [Paenibacillus lutrae]
MPGEQQSVIRKLQIKDQSRPILILNAPPEYKEILSAFDAEIHTQIISESYSFVQVFGTSNGEIREGAVRGAAALDTDGLLWLCYPKKTSRIYKGSDCSRESVAALLAAEGYEPVRQIALDDDWSALRYKQAGSIKKMTRKSAVTDHGKQRVETSQTEKEEHPS